MRRASFRFVGFAAACLLICAPASAGGFDGETIQTDKKLASFQSVHVADVRLTLEPASSYRRNGSDPRPVDDNDAQAKAGDFREELIDALDGAFTIASAPGAGVLTVEATLTKLEATRPTMGDYAQQPGLGFDSVYAGGAAMRIAFSEAGAPLGEVSDAYEATLSDGRPRIGVWEDADRAFSSWARRLVKFVGEN